MENTIKSVKLITSTASGKRFVYAELSSAIDAIAPNTWEATKTTTLKVSLAHFLHCINAVQSELHLDVQFAIETAPKEQFEDVLKDILTMAKVDMVQRHRAAGEVYQDGQGNELVAEFDSVSIDTLKITALSPLGRYAVDTVDFANYLRSPERKNAWRKTRQLVATED